MGRYRPNRDRGEPVEAVEEVDVDEVMPEVDLVESDPEPEQEAPVPSGDVLLKNHNHAGTFYPAGTPVSELNPSATLLEKLKKLGVI